MNPDFPGTAFFYSAWPTVVMLLLFGASVGAALVVLAQEWWTARRERRQLDEATDHLMRIGFLAAESEGLVHRDAP